MTKNSNFTVTAREKAPIYQKKNCTLARWSSSFGSRTALTASKLSVEVEGSKSTEFTFVKLCRCHLIARSLAEESGMRSKKNGNACLETVLETLAKLHTLAPQRHNRGNCMCSFSPFGDSISGCDNRTTHIPDGVISNTNVLFIFVICYLAQWMWEGWRDVRTSCEHSDGL